MDIGAYAQIEDLQKVADANGIKVPRLRGYRLMSEERPIEINSWFKDSGFDIHCVQSLCEQHWDPKNRWYTLDYQTEKQKHRYIDEYDTDTETIRWDRIHGKHRKALKTAIHNIKRAHQKQFDVFNKYVGRKDILFIHARIGGGNWPHYYKEVVDQPWFLEKVDDGFDSTYCDIYAKIEEIK